jgi:DNA-binding NarL/FixJ family response regulator
MSLVGVARDGREAVELALELRPDVVVMDLLMPVCDGIEATRRIAAGAPEIQVVIMSTGRDEDLAMLALRAGAVGFLDKRVGFAALAQVIRGVEQGEAALDRAMTRRLIAELRAATAHARQSV